VFAFGALARSLRAIETRWLLWLAAVVMLGFGVAELPALASMSAHGTGVLGFEFAGSTHRLRGILMRWGATGRNAAHDHVLIDLGFIVGYGALLFGACRKLSGRLSSDRPRLARIATWLAWGALSAAFLNGAQKVILWSELHGHTAQPLPLLAALCGGVTLACASTAAVFVAVVWVNIRHRATMPAR
jgi:hypothetical protein